MIGILCAVFFLSGASALIFEALWFQLAGLTFGNSVWATSIVLSSFMGGLALGNFLVSRQGHRIKFPVRFYAILEIIVAVSGLGLVLLFPYLTKLLAPLFQIFIGKPVFLNALRAFIAMGLMVFPATAMGMTLPLLVRALYAEHPNFGKVLGLLYGWNTLGAMAGVIASEMYLVRWFGIQGAGAAAAAFNLTAAAAALRISHKHFETPEASSAVEADSKGVRFSFNASRVLISGFLSGFILLALEVIWFRFMILFWVPDSWNFAVMLAMVLAGISLGGIFASKLFSMKKDAHQYLPEMFFINAIAIVILYTNFGLIVSWLERFSEDTGIVIASLFLMLPVAFVSGIIFTMLGRALHIELRAETKTTGILTLANTLGAMAGSLVSGLLLIPVLGLEKSFFSLSCLYGLAGLLLLFKKQALCDKKLNFMNAAGAATFIAALAIFPFTMMEQQYLDISIPPALRNFNEKRVAFHEGVTETIQYMRSDLLGQPDYYRLITNSYPMSGTNIYSRRYMKMYVYLPMAIHPDSKKALLICFGCGSTAKAMTDSKNLEHIDIVDISRDVIRMSQVIYPEPEENPVNDPRVSVHVEDGRFFLLTTEKQYDLITAEPPPPKMNGVVNLYSQEYFQLIYDRLADGGIVTYWLPVYQLDLAEAKSIVKGFADVFKETSLWTGAGFEWMMVGVKKPQKKVSKSGFESQWNDPSVGFEMQSVGFANPAQFGSLFIADGERLDQWIQGSLPLLDNYPRRLSRDRIDERTVLNSYRDFMNPAASRENFIKSSGISNIWPNQFVRESLPYFAVRQMVNEAIMRDRMRTTDAMTRLHSIISNPLLSDYILWVFESDLRAQKIVENYLRKNHKIDEKDASIVYHHLAAAAASKKDYRLTDDYLKAALEYASTESSYLYYTLFRMYFRMAAGDKSGAMKIARDYIHLNSKEKSVREKTIAGYYNWMAKVLGQN